MAAPAGAEDLKSRWYFGGNLSFLSTTDDIRSNSAIIFSNQFGDDGIPFTGDPNEVQGCTGNTGGSGFGLDPFCDPRPDDLLSREAAIEETFKLDLTTGYGITSWLSLQLDMSYFRGDVGPVDVFFRQAFPASTNPDNPTNLDSARIAEHVLPIGGGKLTEIPVSLTGVVRFRKDSSLNPYLGIGAGMIFTEMETSGDIDDLNARLGELRIRAVANEFGQEITPLSAAQAKTDGRVPFIYPVDIEVDDAFEWHLTGGAEYFFNDRVSVLFDARYTFADQDLTILMGGQEQVNLFTFAEQLFREDQTLRIYAPKGEAPNPLCSEAGPGSPGCDPRAPLGTQRVNPQGRAFNPADPNDPGSVLYSCPAVADFNKDGQIDICYGQSTFSRVNGPRGPDGRVVVQGGRIDLTGFAVAVGMRFHF